MVILCQVLGSNELNGETRQSAGLYLKNIVGGARSQERINELRKRWNGINKNTKDYIKSEVFKVFESRNKNARDTAAIVIAKIAGIETIKNWTELIPQLLRKFNKSNTEMKQSILFTISMIGEDSNNIDEMQKYTVMMLQCIMQGMSCDNNVRVQGIKCLYNIIDLIKPNMQKTKESDVIMQMICASAQHNNNQLQLYGFMCINKIIERYYENMERYIKTIFTVTKNIISNGIQLGLNGNIDDDLSNICKQAIEVWSTCADIEFERMIENDRYNKSNLQHKRLKVFGFVDHASKLLLPYYLKALTIIDPDTFDDDTLDIRKTCALGLGSFALVSKNKIVGPVVSFVKDNINNKQV